MISDDAMVFRFRRYDLATDEFVTSTRWATTDFINNNYAEPAGESRRIPGDCAKDGLTAKRVKPDNP